MNGYMKLHEYMKLRAWCKKLYKHENMNEI